MNLEIGLLFALIVGLLTVFIGALLWWRSSSTGRNAVLLFGIPFSGKSRLYSQLVFNKPSFTVTSARENVGNVEIQMKNEKLKVLRLVDVPGSEHVRNSALERWITNIRGIIFVIDSVLIESNVNSVAAALYELVNSVSGRSNSRVPLLLACSKQDLPSANDAATVQKLLESELSKLHATRVSALRSQAASVLEKRARPAQLRSMTAEIANASGAAQVDPARLANQLCTLWGTPLAPIDLARVPAIRLSCKQCSLGQLEYNVNTASSEPLLTTQPSLDSLEDWLRAL